MIPILEVFLVWFYLLGGGIMSIERESWMWLSAMVEISSKS